MSEAFQYALMIGIICGVVGFMPVWGYVIIDKQTDMETVLLIIRAMFAVFVATFALSFLIYNAFI